MTVKEFKIHEVIKAIREGSVYEAFGSGIAAIVCLIKSLYYKGETFNIPIEEAKGTGNLTQKKFDFQ